MTSDMPLNRCPLSRNDYNPFLPPQLNDPYPFYACVRQETPVFYSPVLNMWIVSRYSDICAVIKDPVSFSSKYSIQVPPNLPPEVLEVLRGHYLDLPLINHDPPMHTRLRSVLAKAFSRQSIVSIAPTIREMAHQLVDDFIHNGRADLVHQFAYPLSILVITAFLGIPRKDIELFKTWSDDWAMLMWGSLPLEQQVKCAQGCVCFQNYIAALSEERHRVPQNDIITTLIKALREDEYPLSMPEIANIIMGLVFAGHETTTKLIGNALLVLLKQPNQWQVLREDVRLIVNFVEETLRIDGPTQGICRTTAQAVELGGVVLSSGERLLLLFASGNRDETNFPDPNRFDMYRANLEQHLGFGRGIHICLGASLARLEAQIALEVLIQRLPHIPFQRNQAIKYEPNLLLRGPKHLPVEWN